LVKRAYDELEKEAYIFSIKKSKYLEMIFTPLKCSLKNIDIKNPEYTMYYGGIPTNERLAIKQITKPMDNSREFKTQGDYIFECKLPK